MFPSQTISLSSKNQPVKVHLVSTGVVSVKTKFRENKKKGLLAMLDFILDHTFTEWMPIWLMIIEHPEGVFVIDTGENAHINDPDYFKSSGRIARWFDTTQFKFKVQQQEEIGPQLLSLGIPVEKVKAVILTHLHLDHADGLHFFPHTPVLVNRREWEKPFGDLPKLYPYWFKPLLIDLDERFDVFEHAKFLTEAKDLLMVETPGHTFHHSSVLFLADEACIFFGADICYTEEQLVEDKYSGTNARHHLAQDTYRKVRAFAKKNKTVFIPSHDIAASTRLKALQPVMISES
jgi:glyoxylase-like metal-dependent hydrolase (beta-lactamase superfamily II)